MKPCKVCCHPDRGRIDTAIADGHPPLRQLASETGISKTSILRHKAHLQQRSPGAALVLRDSAGAPSGTPMPEVLLTQLEAVCRRLHRLAKRAEKKGDLRAAIGANDAMARQLQQLIRLFAEQERRHEALSRRDSAFAHAVRRLPAIPVADIEAAIAETEVSPADPTPN